jgi:serine/threonine protein kinase
VLVVVPTLARALPPGQPAVTQGHTASPAVAQAIPLAGRTVRIADLHGRERDFVVQGVLGHGKMGTTVLLASDGREQVAVKVADPGEQAETTRSMLEYEAKMLLPVGGAHRGLPGAFGVGMGHLLHADGTKDERVLVLKFVHGKPLGDQNGHSAFSTPREPRAPKLAVQIAMQALEIIDAMRARGIVHRDVHPANLIMEGDDPKTLAFVDFGTAAKLSPNADGSQDLRMVARMIAYLTTRGDAMKEKSIGEMPQVRRNVDGKDVSLADVVRRAVNDEFGTDTDAFRRALAPFAQ